MYALAPFRTTLLSVPGVVRASGGRREYREVGSSQSETALNSARARLLLRGRTRSRSGRVELPVQAHAIEAGGGWQRDVC